MTDEALRQRYRLGTNQGLDPAPPSKPNPGYKKGGRVMKKMKGGKAKGKC